MMRAPRILLTGAVLVGMVAGLNALPAGAADGECGGNLIFHKPIKDGQDRKIGELNIYYNAANGKNCAKTMHAGRTWGKPMQTSVLLMRCRSDARPGSECFNRRDDTVMDSEVYEYYAGPVRIDGRGNCIWASGSVGAFTVVTRPDGKAAVCD